MNERNSILRNRNINKDILDVYDMQLVEFGYNIIIDRLEYIQKLNKYSAKSMVEYILKHYENLGEIKWMKKK